jgi:hypothetical protein
MMLVAGLQTAPGGSKAKVVGLVAAHSGSLQDGAAAVRPLSAFGSPLLDSLGPIAYADLNSMLDPAFPRGALNYWKAQFLTELSDDAIRILVSAFQVCPSPMSHIIVEHVHGAASRVPLSSTACTLRTTGFNVVIVSQWTSAAETKRCIGWARDTFAALTPYLAPRRYVNYLEADAADPAIVAYGPNLPRLRDLKTKWDPDNFFRHNVNIVPRPKDAI